MDLLRKHYEKFILGLFLLALLGWCLHLWSSFSAVDKHVGELGGIMEMGKTASTALPRLGKEEFKGFEALSDSKSELKLNGVATNGPLFEPAAYIRCRNPECFYLLPYNAKLCAWCGTEEKEINTPIERDDSDFDGIPDKAERQCKFLDKDNPNDAQLDEDKDLFTNLEEFRAGTKLDDALSHLAYATKLRFLRVVQNPLPLTFDKLTRSGEDQKDWIFAFNLLENGRRLTRFARLGEKVGPFKVLAVTPRTVTVKDPRTRSTSEKDVSEVTVQRDNEASIKLVRGEQAYEQNVSAQLLFLNDPYNWRNCARYDVRMNDEIGLSTPAGGKERYVVKTITANDAIVQAKDDPKKAEYRIVRLNPQVDFRRQRGADTPDGTPGPGGGMLGPRGPGLQIPKMMPPDGMLPPPSAPQ